MKWLNILAIVLFLLISIPIYWLEKNQSFIIHLDIIELFIAMFFYLILHELFHGIGFLLIKDINLRNITWGIALEKGVFYCMCKKNIHKKDILLEDDILTLGKLLYDERNNNSKRIKFNSIKDKEIKDLTKQIKKYLFCSKSEFYDDYKNFIESISSINEYLYKVNEDNNISKINVDKTLTEGKENYIDNYIYNAIVNHADYMFKSNSKKYKTLNPDDILREIILKEYKKNKNQNRYTILSNYLSNTVPKLKYQNKYKIINAVKSINAEMEEAQKEFSKLFQTDNSYSKN